MKLAISSKWSAFIVFSMLFLAAPLFATTGMLQCLFKHISPAQSGLAAEISPQHKDLARRIVEKEKSLDFKIVKVHNDLTPFLKLSDSLDEASAEQISGLIDVSVNGYPIKKVESSPQGYTLIPVRYDQPLQIEVSLGRGHATSLLEVVKSRAKTQGVEFPSWTDSRFMHLLNLVSFRFTFDRPLDKETEEYFLSVILCEHEQLEKIISQPTPDSVYALAKKYGRPGWFDICIDLPQVKPIES